MKQIITNNLATWTTAPKGIKKLRELILELAVRGLLVPQEANDEPASVLLTKIAAEKARLVSEGKIKSPKPLAKISEEEKPFDLPMGWEFVRLDDIGSTNIGLTYSPNDISNKGIPVLRSSNVQNGKIDLNDLVRVEKDIKSSVFVEEGDLLICARNGSKSLVGKTAMIKNLDEKMTFGAFMAIYRSEYNAYIEVFLNSPVFRNSLEGVNTTTINQITQGNLKSTLTPLPPLAEQQRIVAKVDELMQLCDRLEEKQSGSQAMHRQLVNCLLTTLTEATDAQVFQAAWSRIAANFDCLFTTEHSIEQLKQTILQLAIMGKLVPQNPNDEPASELLKKIATEKANPPCPPFSKGGEKPNSHIVSTFKKEGTNTVPPFGKGGLGGISENEKPFALPNGWEWLKADSVSDFIDPHPSHRTPPEFKNGISYIGYSDINQNKGIINFENARKINPKVFEEHKSRYQLKSGDFVFGKIGTLGKPFFLSEPFDYCLSANLILIQPKQNLIIPKFLATYLDSPIFITILADKKTNSTHGVFGIKKARLIDVPLPPLQEQHRIVTKVDELLTLCEQLKTKLATAKILQQQLAETLVQQAVA
jgi:type I restriction enzyme S subunit